MPSPIQLDAGMLQPAEYVASWLLLFDFNCDSLSWMGRGRGLAAGRAGAK